MPASSKSAISGEAEPSAFRTAAALSRIPWDLPAVWRMILTACVSRSRNTRGGWDRIPAGAGSAYIGTGIGRAGFWRPGRLRPGHWRTAAARSFRMCSGRFSGERAEAPPSSRAGITRNPTITMMWAASFTWRTGRRFWTIWAAANIRRNISRIKDIRFSATGEPATISL